MTVPQWLASVRIGPPVSAIDEFQRFVSTLSRWSTYAAGVLLILVVLHILLEIVLRTALSTSTFVLDEFVGYGVAAVTFLSLGHAFESGALIRINILLSRISPVGVLRRLVEGFCVVSTGFAAGLITWRFWVDVGRDLDRGTVSSTVAEIPLWIPQAAVLAGLIVFDLQLLSYFLRLMRGGTPMASTGLGARSAE
jgi:TRAP-type C4-dicarboxylate transport system permease small subunit